MSFSDRLMKCWQCSKDVSHQQDEDCFFWCDNKCKSTYEANESKIRQERLNVPIISSETVENEKDIEVPKKAPKTFKGNVKPGKRNKKQLRKRRVEKGPRKCGKCGGTGHNARTCGK